MLLVQFGVIFCCVDSQTFVLFFVNSYINVRTFVNIVEFMVMRKFCKLIRSES